MANDNSNEILCSPLTLTETLIVINTAKNGKSVGLDNVPSEVLKLPRLQGVLHRLFSCLFDNGLVPSEWNTVIINPIHKKGKDPRIPTNNRGICLISTVIRRRKRLKQDTYVCFVDFVRAFDSINRDLLWYKLERYGIKGRFLNILTAAYQTSKATIRLSGKYTETFATKYGIRQGDVLAPIMFTLFVNDLAEEVKGNGYGVDISNGKLSILLYADDIAVVASSEEELQAMLNFLFLSGIGFESGVLR